MPEMTAADAGQAHCPEYNSGLSVACESANRRIHNAAVPAGDVFLSEDPSLLAWVARPQVPGGVDDTPPRDFHNGVPHDPSNEARHLRIASNLGDVAVRGDFSLIERYQNLDDPSLAFNSPLVGKVGIGAHGAAANRMFAASYRPNLGNRSNATSTPTSTKRLPSATSIT